MDSSTSKLTQENLAEYRRVAAKRQRARVDRSKLRAEQAWRVAAQAARLLREQFHATRVVVFGSLLYPERFNEWSDIDLAAWGIPADQTFRAIGAVMDLDRNFEINLVDVNTCSSSLRRLIEQEGKDL